MCAVVKVKPMHNLKMMHFCYKSTSTLQPSLFHKLKKKKNIGNWKTRTNVLIGFSLKHIFEYFLYKKAVKNWQMVDTFC